MESSHSERDARDLLFSDDSDTEFFGAELAQRKSDTWVEEVQEPIRRAHQSVTITISVLLVLTVVWAACMALGVCYAYFQQFEDDLEESAARWSIFATSSLIDCVVLLSLLPLPILLVVTRRYARQDVSLRWIALNFIVSYIVNASVALFAYFTLFFMVFRWVTVAGFGSGVAVGTLVLFLFVTAFTATVVTAFQYMLLRVLNRGATRKAVLFHALTTGIGLASSQTMFNICVGAFSLAVKLSRVLSDESGEAPTVHSILLPVLCNIVLSVAEVILLNLLTGIWIGMATIRIEEKAEEEGKEDGSDSPLWPRLVATLPSAFFRFLLLIFSAVPVCVSLILEEWILGTWWHVLWLATAPVFVVMVALLATGRMVYARLMHAKRDYDAF